MTLTCVVASFLNGVYNVITHHVLPVAFQSLFGVFQFLYFRVLLLFLFFAHWYFIPRGLEISKV